VTQRIPSNLSRLLGATLLPLAGTCPAPAAAPGDLDTTFDSGIVTTKVGSQNGSTANRLAQQSDGKILIVGAADNFTSGEFGIARYTVDGSLDASFGTAGKVTTDFSGLYDEAFDVAVQGDGAIVVVGRAQDGSGQDGFGIARYTSDGELDASFGTGGKVYTTHATGNKAFARGVAIQSDGKIVVSGYEADSVSGVESPMLARYNSDGSLDTRFDGDGRLLTAYSTGSDAAFGVAIQPDGKIVVSGHISTGTKQNFAVARFNNDAMLDTTFGTGGKYDIIGFGFVDDSTITPLGLVVQGNRRIIALARYAKGSGNTLDAKFAFQRLRPGGTIDTSFNPGPFSTGAIMHDLRSSVAHANQVPAALAVNGAGIYFAGHVQYVTSNADDYDMVLVRLANDLIFANDFD